MSLLVALNSELLKIKRSAVLYLCFIVAAIVPVVMSFEIFTGSDGAEPIPMTYAQLTPMSQQVFNFLFLPLFVILISTLLAQIEFRNNTWKQVLTAPQTLLNIFSSKYVMLHLLIVLFIVTFTTLLFVVIGLVNVTRPELLEGEFDVANFLLAKWKSYASVFAMSTIQFWMSMRFKNFIVPLAIGFCLWIFAPLALISMNLAAAQYYPYSFSILLSEMSEFKFKPNLQLIQILSISYAAVIFPLAFLDFKFRKVKAGA